MNDKKLLLLLVFVGMCGACFAQMRWEVKAGLNYSNITGKDKDGNKAGTSAVPGIYLGLGTAIRLAHQFALQPTLVYVRRGFKQEDPSGFIGLGKGFEVKVSYVELPIDFMYRPTIGPGNLLVAAGPYLAYGTGGTWSTNGPLLVGDVIVDGTGDIAFQNDRSHAVDVDTYVYAKPWDYGVHVRLGYALFGRYALSFEMQQGIANLPPKWNDRKPENTIRNKSYGVSLAYQF